MHFFSRSRQKLWQKGETSGNIFHVSNVELDCDEDAVLVSGARTPGRPATTGPRRASRPGSGARSCGARRSRAEGSYVHAQLSGGVALNARKVGEEAVELAVAALGEDDERVVSEAADLWFHTLLLLRSRGLDPAAVEDELATARPKS